MTASRRFSGISAIVVLSLALSAPAFAQAGGFVYALDQINGGANQIFGFSVNPSTGVLTPLAGFPVASGTGGAGTFSEMLAYDRVNARLYSLDAGANSVSAFAVNRLSGALTALPFSPITSVPSVGACIVVSPDGSTLAVAGSAALATYKITATSATAAPGSPVAVTGASPFSCAFSQDGASVYTGGNVGSVVAGFAVNATTGALTALAGSPFDTGGANPVGYATDASGRLFVSSFGGGVRAFATSGGIPTAAAGNPFASGLSGGVQGLVTPSGYYMVADRSANRVGVFRIALSGTATTLTAVAGSPFASGGTLTDALAQDHTGTLLFAANGTSRNITTFRVAATGTALTSLTTQAINAVGAAGSVTGLVFAPPATGGFVYALDQVNGGANQVFGFSVNTATGALTALPGFPVAAGIGGAGSFSEHLTYDRLNGRLYVANEGSATITAFSVNRSTGALTALPFSPIVLPAGDWACVAVSPDGGVVAAGGNAGVASFKIAASTATPAPGNPFATSGASAFSCAFSQDGGFFYTGGNVGSVTAGFAVNASTGALTALAGSPFNSGAGNPVGYATDTSGRLFISNFGGGVRAFTTASGIPTAVTGNPFTSGLSGGVGGVVTPSGFYIVADRSGNRVGSYVIGDEGVATTLTAAAGSPFATGGTFSTSITSDDTGTLVFVGNGISRNFTTFSVGASGALTSLGVQAVNALGAAGLVTGVAFAPRVTAASTEITSAGGPRGITSGPDGNVWFTEISGNKIARITTAGVITEFPTPSASGPDGITTGPDGNLWYAGFSGNKIGRVTTAGVITEFPAGAASGPALITAGPDGNLWFTEFSSHKIGRMTTAGVLTEFSAGITALAQPYGITAGPDGNLWFTESAANKIGRITTTGAVTEFPLPVPNSFPAAIVTGPDGALWFAETGTTGTANRIGRITTGGVITEFGGLSAGPGGITLGPDSNLWFSTGTGVGRITTLGAVTDYIPASSPIGSATFPAFITAGPDGNIWFAEQANNKIGIVVLPRFGLSVAKTGTGTGTVTSAPASVSCGATCGATFADGSIVVLSAAASAGSRFAGWSGAGCSGTGTCTVALTSSRLVTATFNQQFTLTVTRVGSGTVTSSPSGVSCGATCAALYDMGSVVTLAASASAGFGFSGWSGAGCSGTGTCVVTVNAATAVTATFVLPTVTVSAPTINFGAVSVGLGTLVQQTPAQTFTLTQNFPATVTWTAAANQPWITVTPASGGINDTITVGIQNTAGTLPPAGLVSGAVTLTTTGALNNPAVTINLTVFSGVSSPPAGSFDTPNDGQGGITGSVAVTGWAVDDIGATAIRIFRRPVPGEDPSTLVFIGNAVFITGARPDVAGGNPLAPYFDRAGWGYLMLTNFLPNQGNGTFTLLAFADDVEGKTTLLGSKTITCTNATATLPFGAIDTPEQGQTIGGAVINFGWVLAAQPTASGLFIPFDGSTVQVFIDSIPIGTATYNNARSDIQALFPGYANTDGAIGFKIFDTTALANGLHTIFWLATDNLGATGGIGSRYFRVSNSVTALMAAPAGASAIASGAAVTVLQGFDANAAVDVVAPDGDGIRRVGVAPLGRVAITLDPSHGVAAYRGFEVINGESMPLPIGSHLDARTGGFVWVPGLAFGGTHHLLFIRAADGREERILVDVTIGPSPAAK
jgi:streptogramin lyase/6-phosphogluconolactonase (cycloisomerase 2 family)